MEATEIEADFECANEWQFLKHRTCSSNLEMGYWCEHVAQIIAEGKDVRAFPWPENRCAVALPMWVPGNTDEPAIKEPCFWVIVTLTEVDDFGMRNVLIIDPEFSVKYAKKRSRPPTELGLVMANVTRLALIEMVVDWLTSLPLEVCRQKIHSPTFTAWRNNTPGAGLWWRWSMHFADMCPRCLEYLDTDQDIS